MSSGTASCAGASAGASAEAEARLAARRCSPSRLALVVDPDPASGRVCRETLERMGFDIEQVESGVAAVVAARRRTPDLILMDAQLRDASAGETIAWLRSNESLDSVPIVVLGLAVGAEVPAKHGRTMAALRKPVSAAAVERAVQDLCG